MEPSELAEKLGRIINKIRRNKNISRNELSEKSGISGITIRRVETGLALGLGLDNLLALAKALDVSMADLIYEAERGEAALRKGNSRWEYVVERVEKFTINQRDWLARILQEIIDRPML